LASNRGHPRDLFDAWETEKNAGVNFKFLDPELANGFLPRYALGSPESVAGEELGSSDSFLGGSTRRATDGGE
jgi:hypothetical protein